MKIISYVLVRLRSLVCNMISIGKSFGGQRKKLIDIGLRVGIQRIWKSHLRTVSKDIGRFEGLDPLSINLYQKYIHNRVCARALLRCFRASVITVGIVEFPVVNENVRWLE